MSLERKTVVNDKIEYIYIPASSKVFLEREAIRCGGLKGAYVNKTTPPMDGFRLKDYGATKFDSMFDWPGIEPGQGENGHVGFSYYIPTSVYNDYVKNPKNPWYDVTAYDFDDIHIHYKYKVSSFDFGKDKLPFPVK